MHFDFPFLCVFIHDSERWQSHSKIESIAPDPDSISTGFDRKNEKPSMRND
jgi:hypothetical protein